MNEASVVRYLVSGLKDRLPGAVIFKHADLITAGIPDVSITYKGRTLWIEVKLIKNWREPISLLRKKFDQLQLANMCLLDRAGRSLYVVSFTDDNDRKLLGVYEASYIICALASELGPIPPQTSGQFFEGSYTDVCNKLANRIKEGQ